jgi:sister chromatid cohesion protein DCC1
MRWFGQVDDADGRWKMNVEKVVRQVGLGILRFRAVSFPSLIPCLVLYLQSDPISDDEFMTKYNIAVGDTFISNTPRRLFTVCIPLSASEFFITDENRETFN